jgi:hypothetical protein
MRFTRKKQEIMGRAFPAILSFPSWKLSVPGPCRLFAHQAIVSSGTFLGAVLASILVRKVSIGIKPKDHQELGND